MSRWKPMPLVEAFQRRTSDILSSMRSRFRGKWNKKKTRLLQVGREVPIDLEEFRAWVVARLGGTPDGCGQCEYCGRPLDAMDFRVDHRLPVSRGGDLGLANCVFSCDECNRVKGQLSGDEFRWLLEVVSRMSTVAQKDVKERLKMGAGFRRLRFFGKQAKNPPPLAASQQLPLEEPF